MSEDTVYAIHQKSRIADEAVDLLNRGVDARQRLTLAPDVAVDLVCVTRALAASARTSELFERAISDPDWARGHAAALIAQIAAQAARRAREDQTSEAEILRSIVGPGGAA